jgi:hypothetical protein
MIKRLKRWLRSKLIDFCWWEARYYYRNEVEDNVCCCGDIVHSRGCEFHCCKTQLQYAIQLRAENSLRSFKLQK